MRALILLQLVLLVVLATLNGCQGCYGLWYNQCSNNRECCSGNCDDNNGNWAKGVCKPNYHKKRDLKYLKKDRVCYDLFYDQCLSHSECCSDFCDNNNGLWPMGVCKPNLIVVNRSKESMEIVRHSQK